MPTVYLGLGSNLGDRKAHLREAVDALAGLVGTWVTAVSPLYCTKPWGRLEQPDFLNMVVEIKTDLAPDDLLRQCKGIERDTGRTPTERWGPRVIDIDILLYGDALVQT